MTPRTLASDRIVQFGYAGGPIDEAVRRARNEITEAIRRTGTARILEIAAVGEDGPATLWQKLLSTGSNSTAITHVAVVSLFKHQSSTAANAAVFPGVVVSTFPNVRSARAWLLEAR